ncbi:hypothetical protein C2S51_024095 [Perilla frutescens var. frutescens]|nr:hypothetical protein C2S51_024095 [Perilla frutescens var. frutescens]
MARHCCCSSSSLLCLMLMTVVFLLPAADATFITPNVQGLFVNGTLCCSQNGNCPGSGPLAGVNVTLTCKNLLVATVVGQNITNANGTFSITVPAASLGSFPLLFPSLACVATVQLPVSSAICPALSATSGTLVALLQTVGTITSQTLGLLQALQVVATITLGL